MAARAGASRPSRPPAPAASLRASFLAWRGVTQESTRLRCGLESLEYRRIRAAAARWRARAAERAGRSRLRTAASAASRLVRAERGVRTWLLAWATALRVREARAAALRARLRGVVRQWAGRARVRAAARRRHAEVEGLWRARLLRKVLHGVAEVARDALQDRADHTRADRWREARLLRRAWSRLALAAEEAARERACHATASRHAARSISARYFSQWRARLPELAAERARLAHWKAATDLAHLRRDFASWARLAASRGALRRVLLGLEVRARRGAAAQALARWHAFSKRERLFSEGQPAVAARAHRLRTLVLRWLALVGRHRRGRLAVLAWRHWTLRRRAIRMRLALRPPLAVRGVQAWLARLRAARVARHRREQLRHFALRRAVRRWRAAARAGSTRRAADSQRLRGALRRWGSRGPRRPAPSPRRVLTRRARLTRAVAAWRRFTAESLARYRAGLSARAYAYRAALRGTLAVWRAALRRVQVADAAAVAWRVRRALTDWRGAAASKRHTARATRAQRLQRVLWKWREAARTRAASRTSKAPLRRAVAANQRRRWIAAWRALAAGRVECASAARRLQLRSAVRAWRSAAKANRAQATKECRALQHWAVSLESRVWARWLVFIAQRRSERAAEERADALRRRQLLRHAAAQWIAASVARRELRLRTARLAAADHALHVFQSVRAAVQGWMRARDSAAGAGGRSQFGAPVSVAWPPVYESFPRVAAAPPAPVAPPAAAAAAPFIPQPRARPAPRVPAELAAVVAEGGRFLAAAASSEPLSELQTIRAELARLRDSLRESSTPRRRAALQKLLARELALIPS